MPTRQTAQYVIDKWAFLHATSSTYPKLQLKPPDSESSQNLQIDDRRTLETGVEPLLVEQLVTWILALVIGLVLWSIGGKILRPSLGMAGLIIGAALGWLAWTQIQGHAPLWALMLGTGVITSCVFMLAYKLVLAGILSILLSVFFMAASWSSMQAMNEGDPPSATIECTWCSGCWYAGRGINH